MRRHIISITLVLLAAATPAHARTLSVNGNWQSLVNCAFTAVEPSGHFQCVGSTLWLGTLTGVTRYAIDGTLDPISGDASGRLHETFRGRDDDGDRGTIGFDETFTLDGATSALHIDVSAIGGSGGFAGARGWMTFDGTDNLVTGYGTYTGQLRLRSASR